MKFLSMTMVVTLAALFMGGCGGDKQEESLGVGTLSMALTSTSASGVEYQLRFAEFAITGPQDEDILSEDYLGDPAILVPLRDGDYQVMLQPGWLMEHRVPPLTWSLIPAVLVSPNPLAVNVPVDQVAPAVFQFEVDEGVIVFATGILDISIDVDEVGGGGGTSGTPICGDGVTDPGESCDPPNVCNCDASCRWKQPCNDFNDCTDDMCTVNPVDNTPECTYFDLDGLTCWDFLPDSGICVADVCTIVIPSTPDPVTRIVPIVASNTLTGDISELAYELTVTPLDPVVVGAPASFDVTGIAVFPESFLNAALAAIGPVLTEVTLGAVTATPHIRSGAVGAPVDLTTLTSPPANVPIPISSSPTFCGPLNLDSCPNTCTDGAACSQGSAMCFGIGDGTCLPRGACLCASAPIQLPLSTSLETVTPSGTGPILFGWNEDLLPPQVVFYIDPPGPNGIRLIAGGLLQVAIEGWMGKLSSPTTAEPLLDSELISIPLAQP